MATILVREGKLGQGTRRQYLIVSDAKVVIVDMTPALFGWNVGKVTVQDGDDWGTQTEQEILAWEAHYATDDLTKVWVPEAHDAEFRAKLLRIAGVGQ